METVPGSTVETASALTIGGWGDWNGENDEEGTGEGDVGERNTACGEFVTGLAEVEEGGREDSRSRNTGQRCHPSPIDCEYAASREDDG